MQESQSTIWARVEAMSPARLDAELELDGQRLVRQQGSRPRVQRECICVGHGEPDAAGMILISPACLVHGLHTPVVRRFRGD